MSAREAAPKAGAQTAKLRTEDLHKSFGQRPVLDGVSLSIGAGESLVIVGPSGTGKSVLLKHFIGLLRPDSGKVFADGVDLWSLDHVQLNELRKKFGMAFQEGALFDSMSVYDNVAFPLRRSGQKPAEVRARVEECLELVQLPDVAAKRPSQLSGGMRRRVGFARAIAHKPEILLFDEPNTGLDPIMTDIIAEVILGIRRQLRADDRDDHASHARARARSGTGSRCFRRPYSVRGHSRRVHGHDRTRAVRQFVEGQAVGPLTGETETGTRKTIWEATMSTAAKVGAFFLFALAVTGILIWNIEDLKLGRRMAKTVTVEFTDVAGLKEKADVRVAGVLVGRVAQVRLVGGRRWSTSSSTGMSSCTRGPPPESRPSACSATTTSSCFRDRPPRPSCRRAPRSMAGRASPSIRSAASRATSRPICAT